MAHLARRAQTGGAIEDLAQAAVDTIVTLFETPCVVLLELRDQALAPLASAGWPGPVHASLVDPDRPEAGVTVSRAEAAAAGVNRVSLMAVPLVVRGRPWAVLAVHSRSGRTAASEDDDRLRSVAHLVAAARETRLAHEELEHLILHDALTGLPNRAQIADRLEHAIRRRRPERMLLAVVCLDVDQFATVNDTLGHRFGDLLLVELAARLRRAARPDDIPARYGGDKFLVLCEGLPSAAAVRAEAERLRQALSGPMRIQHQEVEIATSAGVVIAQPDTTADEVLRDADLAMHTAKERATSRATAADRPPADRNPARTDLESDLRRALRHDEFLVYYQPVVDLEDGVVLTTEGLVRWAHPQRGLVPPAQFIPIAEASGLIVPLGEWVLNTACQQAQRWEAAARAAGTAAPGVSVNLSGRQISEPWLLDQVRAALATSGLSPGQLTLEITESVVMGDAEAAVEALGRCKDLGVNLSIDDFGTGYSSLSYLKRFPIDTVKIDRSFVSGLGTDPDDAIIVGAIVHLADVLGIATVAEGVETSQQVAELLRLGCTQGQGYYFARPQPAEALTARLGL